MTDDNSTIFIVDDQKQNIQILAGILGADYNIRFATSGAEAMDKISTPPYPDLILLDIMMPQMSGYEVCRILKNRPATASIPVIFVTALNELENETEGFNAGGVDYITKPVRPAIVKARVAAHLALYDQRKGLDWLVKERTKELQMTRDATIYGLAGLAETRDNETGKHIRRTQLYVEALARHLHQHSRYSDQLNEQMIDILAKSTPLHDIGKVGIPDRILLKPGKLDESEFEIMKTHVLIGQAAISKAESALDGAPSTFLASAGEICASHHEKFNGTGYPLGLKGTEIPLTGRIMAICDVYDALISRRVYKPPFPHSQAVEIIKKERSEHFDPVIVDAFLAISEVFRKIAIENIDDPKDAEFLLK